MAETILYLDCPTGASGDMLNAALCACGLDMAVWEAQLRKLDLPNWQLAAKTVEKNQLAAHKIDFIYPEEHTHRHLSDILPLIEAAGFSARATQLAQTTFRLLAEAESKAHGCSVEEVHFHEVGAVDAILDICGVAVALDMLDVRRVYCSPLPLSHGYVDCAHGRMPVPAPATLNLLTDFELVESGLRGELITPTGAALLKGMKAEQRIPAMRLLRVGLGAGNRDLPQPNVLRALLGEAQEQAVERDEVDVLHCNLDDSTGELLGHLLPLLLQAGARDACYAPLIMKKNRPAWQLQIICAPEDTERLAALVFAESSGIGLRVSRERRITIARASRSLETPYGPIRVKYCGNNIAPEYEDVAAAAQAHGLPYKRVLQEVLALALQEGAQA